MSALVTTEKSVQAACLQWLNTIPRVKCWRQNTGTFFGEYTSKRTGLTKQRRMKFGEVGQGDIGGIGPYGVRIEIEIKRPGSVPSENQNIWRTFIQDHSGIAFYCDSLRSCVEQLRAEFQKRGWPWLKSWECW